MRMIVYVDLIFLFNFLVDFIFLYVTEKIFKDDTKILRMVIVSSIGGIIAIFSCFNKYIFQIYKIMGGVILIVLGIRKITFSKSIIKISMFYLENLALVGVLTTFKINNLLMFSFALGVILVLLFFEHFKNYYIFLSQNKYNVIVTKNNKKMKIEAILDTGNSATNKDGIPLVFISQKYYSESFDKYELVLVETVNNEKIEKAYFVDEFIIIINGKKVKKEALIVFSDVDVCLLNSMLLI